MWIFPSSNAQHSAWAQGVLAQCWPIFQNPELAGLPCKAVAWLSRAGGWAGGVCLLRRQELQHPPSRQSTKGASLSLGLQDLSYQTKVQSVVVIFRHGQVHSQRHTVGKDGEQDDGLKGSGVRVKESGVWDR